MTPQEELKIREEYREHLQRQINEDPLALAMDDAIRKAMIEIQPMLRNEDSIFKVVDHLIDYGKDIQIATLKWLRSR